MAKLKRHPVKSADRVLDVLELLGKKGRAMPHAEIAAALRIPKSSLTQLLRNLNARGFVALEPGPNTYSLGRAFFELARQAGRRIDLAAIAKPALERLTAETGESSSYNVYRGDYTERIAGVDSPQALAYRMTVGARFPLYASSGGKAVLAGLPLAEREEYLSSVKLERHTEATVKSLAELRRQLGHAVQEGVAYSRGEHTRGIVAVAAAVHRADGYPTSAVSVVMPSVRFNPEVQSLCVRAVKAAAASIEAELQARLSRIR